METEASPLHPRPGVPDSSWGKGGEGGGKGIREGVGHVRGPRILSSDTTVVFICVAGGGGGVLDKRKVGAVGGSL
jgi:hypothetical protein